MPQRDSIARAQFAPVRQASGERAPGLESRCRLGGRYELYGEIAAGGMASIQYGRLVGARGFVRAVAIKQLHPQFAREPDFVTMFVDEARLSARLVHANIIPTLDVVDAPGELALVMEYVHGESLWSLLKLSAARGEPIPLHVACGLLAAVLHGLHAAHETCNDAGEPLHIVHRDVSPHNILVGADGIPRIFDFGIAKAIGRLRTTPSGEIKGKLSYIAPEQLQCKPVDRRADVYGAATVLWETLTGHALFDGPNESAIVREVLFGVVEPPSVHRAGIPPLLDAIVLRALDRDLRARFGTAREMASLLEHEVGLATQSEISDWLHGLAGEKLRERAQALSEMQEQSAVQAVKQRSSTRRIEVETAAPPSAASARDATPAIAAPLRIRQLMAWAALAACALAAWALFRTPPSGNETAPSAQVAPPEPEHETAPGAQAPPAPQPTAAADSAIPAETETDIAASTQPAAASGKATQPDAPALAPRAKRIARRADAVLDTGVTAPPAPRAAKPERVPALNAGKPHLTPKRSSPLPRVEPIAPRPDCNPYFYIDSTGIRRPKPGCL